MQYRETTTVQVVDQNNKKHIFCTRDIAGVRQVPYTSSLVLLVCAANAHTHRRVVIQMSSQNSAQSEAHRLQQLACERRPLPGFSIWVVVNPASGTQSAETALHKSVLPLLNDVQIAHSVSITQYPQHALVLAQEANLSDVGAILVLAGDGVVSELITGLNRRSDSLIALATPLTVAPCGTGNGLARSIVHELDGPHSTLRATLAAIKGRTAKLDALKFWQRRGDSMKHPLGEHVPLSTSSLNSEQVDAQNNMSAGSAGRNADGSDSAQCVLGMLSLSWGFAADVDIESEGLRALGAARFDIQALWRLARLRTYDGFLRVLSAISGEWQALDLENCVALWIMNVPFASWSYEPAPHARAADGVLHVVIFREATGCCNCETGAAIVAAKDGKHIEKNSVEIHRIYAFELTPDTTAVRGPDGGGRLVIDGELAAVASSLTTKSKEGGNESGPGTNTTSLLPFTYNEPLIGKIMPSALTVCHLRR